jgi:hypothetical protein
MQLGKHVFCQKPLTHSVFEARQMRLAAKKFNVVTQMGNQIQSHEAYRTAVKLVHDGAIGKVKEVHSWQAGAMRWMLVDDRPRGSDPVPEKVHWDTWLGVAPERPFKEKIYHDFNWRAWQDFSNGQLGDFGCHILDPVFLALGLTAPTTIKAEAPPLNREVWTKWCVVQYEFPGTERTAGKTLPLTWYDGEGNIAARQARAAGTFRAAGVGVGADRRQGNSPDSARRIAEAAAAGEVRRLQDREGAGGGPLRRLGGRLSWRGQDDVALRLRRPADGDGALGTVAIRVPGETLMWDATQLKVTNSPRPTGAAQAVSQGMGAEVVGVSWPRLADEASLLRLVAPDEARLLRLRNPGQPGNLK